MGGIEQAADAGRAVDEEARELAAGAAPLALEQTVDEARHEIDVGEAVADEHLPRLRHDDPVAARDRLQHEPVEITVEREHLLVEGLPGIVVLFQDVRIGRALGEGRGFLVVGASLERQHLQARRRGEHRRRRAQLDPRRHRHGRNGDGIGGGRRRRIGKRGRHHLGAGRRPAVGVVGLEHPGERAAAAEGDGEKGGEQQSRGDAAESVLTATQCRALLGNLARPARARRNNTTEFQRAST